MPGRKARGVVGGLLVLFGLVACNNSDCGGYIQPLDGEITESSRVYAGVQTRVTGDGLDFVEHKLPEILDSLMEDDLVFEIPASEFSYWGVSGEICATPCPAELELRHVWITPAPPDRIGLEVLLNVDTTVTMDSWLLGSCQFPVELRSKPVQATIMLRVDPLSGLVTTSLEDLSVDIYDHEYQIQCPFWYDWLLELLKGYVTDILNEQLAGHLDQAADSVMRKLTCLPCEFYASGCPAGTDCSEDGYCESDGMCTARPLGLAGIPDLSRMTRYMSPAGHARLEMLLAPGQRAEVTNGGLELDWITGVNAERCDCVPEAAPEDMPQAGEAEQMRFDDTVPGRGIPYMLGVSLSDRYLDNLLFHAWRSGLLCLDYVYDNNKYDWLNSKALEIFIPSLAALSGGEALPGKLTLRPEKVPEVRIGAGGFPAESGLAAPQLQAFFRDVHMALWLQFQGRWVRILVLTQDIQIDLGLDLTPENRIIPVLAEEGISVSSIRVSDNEFLGEEELLLQELVPYLAGIVIPKFGELLERLAIPQFFGFALEVRSVQGDVQLPESDFYRFLSVYADLRFTASPPPPPPVQTRVSLIDSGPDGFEIEILDPDHEVQYRIDEGIWSAFQTGPRIAVRRMLLPGPHQIEIRARKIGDYLTLDDSAERLLVQTTGLPQRLSQPVGDAHTVGRPPSTDPNSRVGCATSGEGRSAWFLLVLLGLAWLGSRPH